MKTQLLACGIALFLGTPAAPQTDHQPYKGLETRNISSLSEKDIDALETGTGWGLALPAELNGYPGPAHVLELKSELGLSQTQITRVQALFDAMKKDAIARGMELINAERQLDAGFKSGGLTSATLKGLIERAEKARAELRFVHLSRSSGNHRIAERCANSSLFEPCVGTPLTRANPSRTARCRNVASSQQMRRLTVAQVSS